MVTCNRGTRKTPAAIDAFPHLTGSGCLRGLNSIDILRIRVILILSYRENR